MPHLKAVIFSLRDVILHQGPIKRETLAELGRLLQLIQARGITPVFLANQVWYFEQADGSEEDAQKVVTQHWGKFPWYVANRDGTPHKPTKEATQHVLKKHGWKPHEVVYVGNTVEDMRTAVNGGLLFLNAKWHGEATDYGFAFNTPSAIGRFIDVFCTRDSLWYFKIEDGPLRMYAMGSRDEQASRYTDDARFAAKFDKGTAPFWKQYLISTLYLSGLCDEFDFAAPYPGHSDKVRQQVTHDDMLTLTKCFRARYLPDLIVRHRTATKLQTARIEGKPVDHRVQLDTIRLTRLPQKADSGERYKNNPLKKGKTVLVLDDICTQGLSLEAARTYIEKTGASVVLVAWLKTPNRPYLRLDLQDRFDPFKTQTFARISVPKAYSFGAHVVDAKAPASIADRLDAYKGWDWPKGIK